jgi:hypothetical protein
MFPEAKSEHIHLSKCAKVLGYPENPIENYMTNVSTSSNGSSTSIITSFLNLPMVTIGDHGAKTGGSFDQAESLSETFGLGGCIWDKMLELEEGTEVSLLQLIEEDDINRLESHVSIWLRYLNGDDSAEGWVHRDWLETMAPHLTSSVRELIAQNQDRLHRSWLKKLREDYEQDQRDW